MNFYGFRPVANPAAVIIAGNFRVTVLTSRCLRIEYSSCRRFNDFATLTFTIREQPVPRRAIEQPPDGLVVTTDSLSLRITSVSRPPDDNTTAIRSTSGDFEWHFGSDERRNLLGTTRTLDMVTGCCELGRGLISRDGFTTVDDANAPLIDATGKFAANDSEIDTYFFGYGHDYNGCISDFLKLSGMPPLLPRYAYGVWWSRYWRYRAHEMLDVADAFASHGVPLSVYVIDMDWHVTETGNASRGWTGYTFNRDLIPDPPGLLRALHDRGLRVTLNLHPADGVWPHEEQHAEMARRMGVSPTEPVPFDCSSMKFMRQYFDLLHHPYEELGVDFWWIDWQQGTGDIVDPLIVLNHHHFADAGRDGHRRPLIMSRWCGLGGQRYPIGFSGDTTVDWPSLQFQPYFTATAANVGFGFWSHDIGGHFAGVETGELYVRWLQFGALLPILRMHCNDNAFHERPPWKFGPSAGRHGINALKLHGELLPLFYSLGYRNHVSGLQPVRPMYYLAPGEEDSYNCPAQFALGDDIIVAPIIVPIDQATGLAAAAVWLPPGVWFDFQTGRQYTGGWHRVAGELSKIPIFVRAGGVVPTEVEKVLTLHVFPLGTGQFEVYEDDGVSVDGPSDVTKIATRWDAGRLTMALTGDGPVNRTIAVRLRNIVGSAQVAVENGELVSRSLVGEEVEVKVEVRGWPALLVAFGENLVVPKFGVSNERLMQLIRALRINTYLKQSVYRMIKEAPPAAVAQVIAENDSLPDAAKVVLFGELCDFGWWHFTKQMGKDILVLWNTQRNPAFTCTQFLHNRQQNTGKTNQRAEGVVPQALSFEPTGLKTQVDTYCPGLFTKKMLLEIDVAGCHAFSIDFDKL
jgi:hypothetical protein